MTHDDDDGVIQPGTVFELVPHQPEYNRPHRLIEDTKTIGCWCEPVIMAYMGEDGGIDYFTVDHHFIH